jgi:cytochrome c oxidase assembly factor 5
MSNYCGPLLAALKDCVLHSDCVLKNGKLPSECIKHHLDELPEECRSLRLATFECKRGMVNLFTFSKSCIITLLMLLYYFFFKLDMRKRFRGNSASAAAARIKEESAPTPTTGTTGST